jgi:hypothetical protein
MIGILCLVAMALLIAVASVWGADSRDGRDWRFPDRGDHLE